MTTSKKSALAYELFFSFLLTNLKIDAVLLTFTSLWTLFILQSAVGHSFEGCKSLEKFPFSFTDSTKAARHQLALKCELKCLTEFLSNKHLLCILLICG